MFWHKNQRKKTKVSETLRSTGPFNVSSLVTKIAEQMLSMQCEVKEKSQNTEQTGSASPLSDK